MDTTIDDAIGAAYEGDDEGARMQIEALIAAAVLAERERCAAPLELVRAAARVVVGAYKLDAISRKGDGELRAAALATLTPEEKTEAEAEAHRVWLDSKR